MKLFALFMLVFAFFATIPEHAYPGNFELSLQGSYYRTNYDEISDQSFSAMRRADAGFGYYFTKSSQIELSYSWYKNETVYEDYQIMETVDQTVSIDWNQTLVPGHFTIQPYLKAGVGLMQRSQEGQYTVGVTYLIEKSYKSETLILGFGLRVYITKSFALKGQYTSYLPGFDFQELKNNYGFTGGLSWVF